MLSATPQADTVRDDPQSIQDRQAAEVFLQLADSYLKQKEFVKAKKVLQLLANKLNDSAAMIILAILYKRERNFPAAILECQRAVNLLSGKSKEGLIRHELALIYRCAGKMGDAKIEFKRSADLGEISAMNHLALMYEAEGRIPEAEAEYKRAFDLDTKAAGSGDSSAMLRLGDFYRKRRNLEEAEKEYRRAADLDTKAAGSGDYKAMRRLGDAYQKRGNLEESERDYQRAADLGDVGAMYKLAAHYNEKQQYLLATSWFDKAIVLTQLSPSTLVAVEVSKFFQQVTARPFKPKDFLSIIWPDVAEGKRTLSELLTKCILENNIAFAYLKSDFKNNKPILCKALSATHPLGKLFSPMHKKYILTLLVEMRTQEDALRSVEKYRKQLEQKRKNKNSVVNKKLAAPIYQRFVVSERYNPKLLSMIFSFFNNHQLKQTAEMVEADRLVGEELKRPKGYLERVARAVGLS